MTQSFGTSAGKYPCEGPKASRVALQFTDAGTQYADLFFKTWKDEISLVQSIFVDNYENQYRLIVESDYVGHKIYVPAASQGYFNIMTQNPPNLKVTLESAPVSPLNVTLQVLNFPVSNTFWKEAAAPPNVFLDDLSVEPEGAWGLTRLYSTATDAIRVRRASDNALQIIGFNGDDLDIAALESFCSGTDGYVHTFYDQKTGALNVEQTSNSLQAQIVSGGVYLGSVDFAGAQGYVSIINTTMGTAFAWLFAQCEQPTSVSVRIMFELSSNYSANNDRFAVYNYSVQGDVILAMGYAGSKISSFDNDNGILPWVYVFDKSTTGVNQLRCFRDDVELTPTPINVANPAGTFEAAPLNVGARANGGSFNSTMKLRTFALYNVDVSAIRATISSILAR